MTDSAEEAGLRLTLVTASRRLAQLGLVSGEAGNLSARLEDGDILITASQRSKWELAEADIVRISPDGDPREPGAPRISSEVSAHLHAYRASGSYRAVVHAHPVHATAIAPLGDEVNLCITAEGAACIGPVARVRYLEPGTDELGAAVGRAARVARAILLLQHGALTVDASLEAALHRMETLEHVARQWTVARAVGRVAPLPDEVARRLRALLGSDPSAPLAVFDVE